MEVVESRSNKFNTGEKSSVSIILVDWDLGHVYNSCPKYSLITATNAHFIHENTPTLLLHISASFTPSSGSFTRKSKTS
jgi:hypothetical protein